MTEFEKHQLRIILRNNPGITQKEILYHIENYKMPGHWYHQKVSRILQHMILNGEPIKEISKYNNQLGRSVYTYYYNIK